MRSIVTVRLLLLSLVLGAVVLAEPSPAYGEVSVTIYNQDLGLVKDVRELQFQKGRSIIKFTDVAARIDPTSVHFKPVNPSDRVSILEQNYQYDLVSSSKILQKYVDREIELFARSAGSEAEGKSYKGRLLSYSSDNVTLQEPEGAIRIVRLDEVRDLSLIHI